VSQRRCTDDRFDSLTKTSTKPAAYGYGATTITRTRTLPGRTVTVTNPGNADVTTVMIPTTVTLPGKMDVTTITISGAGEVTTVTIPTTVQLPAETETSTTTATTTNSEILTTTETTTETTTTEIPTTITESSTITQMQTLIPDPITITATVTETITTSVPRIRAIKKREADGGHRTTEEPAPMCTAAQSPVANGGFEGAATDQWNTSTTSALSFWRTQTDIPHGGTQYATFHTASGRSVQISQTLSLCPGSTYAFSVWTRYIRAKCSLTVMIGDQVIATVLPAAPVANQQVWTQTVGTYSPQQESEVLVLMAACTSVVSQLYHVDDFSLTRV
jgi:hypothetical protein